MATLRFERVEVTALADGTKEAADLVVCDQCNSETFLVFQLVRHAHPHYQCAQCGVSFCPGGKCEQFPRDPESESK